MNLDRLIVDRPLAFLDLETTGTDPQEDRIVEIAVHIHYPVPVGEPAPSPLTKVRRLNPGVPIPAEATEIHGIRTEDVANEPTFWEIATSLATLLDPCDLAGFNIRRFDLPLLVAEFKRRSSRFDPKLLPTGEPRRIIDLQQLFHLEEPRDLQAAVRRYTGGEHLGAHSAAADTRALPQVLLGMLERHTGVAELDLDGLHARCDEFAPYRTEVERWFGDDLEHPVLQHGKHAGKGLGEVDNGYVTWMLRELDSEVADFVREFLRRPQPAAV